MNKIKTFDCVEFQRSVRLSNFEEANGNFDLMLKNQKKRIKKNELWLKLLKSKAEASRNAVN